MAAKFDFIRLFFNALDIFKRFNSSDFLSISSKKLKIQKTFP